MKRLTSSKLSMLALAVGLGLALLGIFFGSRINQGPTMIVDFNIDPNSKRALVGGSSHVFVARVIANQGSIKTGSGMPEVAFSAEVLDMIKGEMPKEVRLAYVTHADKGMIRMDQDPKLLELGKSYLFIASYNSENDLYNVFQGGYGHILITDEQQQTALVAQYTEAYKTELTRSDPNFYEEMSKDAKPQSGPYPAAYDHLYPAPDAVSYPDPKQ